MTFRGVQADKVLFTGHNRLRVSCAGVRDLLESDSQIPLLELQVMVPVRRQVRFPVPSLVCRRVVAAIRRHWVRTSNAYAMHQEPPSHNQ